MRQALVALMVELHDNVRTGVVQLDRRARILAANDAARALPREPDLSPTQMPMWSTFLNSSISWVPLSGRQHYAKGRCAVRWREGSGQRNSGRDRTPAFRARL